MGSAAKYGALFALSLLQPFWDPKPHRFLPTVGLWGVVEAQHLREHDRARSVQLHNRRNHIVADSRNLRRRARLAHLKPQPQVQLAKRQLPRGKTQQPHKPKGEKEDDDTATK